MTGDLFARTTPAEAVRRERLMAVMDGVNARWGRGTLCYLAEGFVQPWQMRRGRMTPRYTTCWEELPGVG